MKFQREKITTGWDITKNVEGGGRIPPPALLGLIKQWGTVGSYTNDLMRKTGIWATDDAIEHFGGHFDDAMGKLEP